jgi:hypothetical protein
MRGKGGVFSLLLLVILFTVPTPSNSTEMKNDRDTILVLGEELSRLDNMLEVFAMIGTDVEYKAPKKRLKDSMEKYESEIKALQGKYPDGEIADILKKALKHWNHVKKDLGDAFKGDTAKEQMKKDAIDVHREIGEMIEDMEKIKDIVVKASKLSNIKELNAMMGITSSSKGISAHYLMKMWDLNDESIGKHLDKEFKIYGESLSLLDNSEFAKDKEFAPLLEEIKKEYKFSAMLIKMTENGKYTPALMQEHTDKATDAALKMIKIILDSCK